MTDNGLRLPRWLSAEVLIHLVILIVGFAVGYTRLSDSLRHVEADVARQEANVEALRRECVPLPLFNAHLANVNERLMEIRGELKEISRSIRSFR